VAAVASRRVIGIDTGGTKLLGGVVDENGTVHARVHRLFRGASREEALQTMSDAVEEARAHAPDVEAVGFGIPSLVDQKRGMSVTSVHLPIEDVPFREIMTERIGLPVFMDNDGNLAALVEQRSGAARGAQHVVLLTLGTGIGGGLVLDGKIYRGSIGAGAELGHMVIDLDGPRCQGNCPNRGCLEALVSGTAIGRAGTLAAQRNPGSGLWRSLAAGDDITGRLVTEHAQQGDEVARRVLERAGRHLGVGIANLVNIFNPEVVVVGGGAVGAGELLLAPARVVVGERALRPSRDLVRIRAAHHGPEAGMLGAALLAFDGLAERAGVEGAGAAA
jgi:glucokinase